MAEAPPPWLGAIQWLITGLLLPTLAWLWRWARKLERAVKASDKLGALHVRMDDMDKARAAERALDRRETDEATRILEARIIKLETLAGTKPPRTRRISQVHMPVYRPGDTDQQAIPDAIDEDNDTSEPTKGGR